MPQPARSIDSLPKWARSRIELLEQRLAAAERRLAEDPDTSRVFASPNAKVPLPLGDHPTVRFYIGADDDNQYVDVRISDSHPYHGPGVQITHGDMMAVVPQSSNVVHITSLRLPPSRTNQTGSA